MIVFNKRTGSTAASNEIYTVFANGTGLRRITNNSSADYHARWSPDGSELVFNSDRSGNPEIYTMRIDGTGVHRVTTSSSADFNPAWSPDGQWIAFTSDRSGNLELYKVHPDGSGLTRLTTNAADDYSPTWSPTGAKLAFTSNRSGNYEIWTMNADGSGLVNVTNNPADDERAAWSPDGTKLVFETDREGDREIYVMDANGASPYNISVDYATDWWPDWQPIPDFPLVDARFSIFDGDIVWLYNAGITKGCSDERFCPDDPVTRGQMAAFLDRALHLAPSATDYFSDDNSSIFEADINALAAAGITKGCTATTFCPNADVTRGQMAAFLVRALGLPGTTNDYFTDDNGTTFESDINRLAAAGITKGCTATTFCPDLNVTRGQMAAFLHRALG